MNKKSGKIGAMITGIATLSFAISMIVGLFTKSVFASCFSSMFIAIGFLPFMISIYSVNANNDKKAIGMTGIAFGIVYAVLIFIVYYAECTTIRLNSNLSNEALSIISYSYLGSLFFNYNLLGYAFMALSTFLIGFIVEAKNKASKTLKIMLIIHGVFFLSCLLVPLFPVFTTNTESIVGTVLLEIWCAYFLPICILGYRYFRN
jgi:isoprenylcysteine carboxyl methyltransferase (ICMT) family protein YpbQ